jgi:outer membrane protein TolC
LLPKDITKKHALLNTNPLPDYDELLKEMQQNNLTLRAAALERQSREETKKSAKAEGRPEIFLQLEAAEYQRDFRSREPLKAILGLDVPLYRGARTRS